MEEARFCATDMLPDRHFQLSETVSNVHIMGGGTGGRGGERGDRSPATFNNNNILTLCV